MHNQQRALSVPAVLAAMLALAGCRVVGSSAPIATPDDNASGRPVVQVDAPVVLHCSAAEDSHADGKRSTQAPARGVAHSMSSSRAQVEEPIPTARLSNADQPLELEPLVTRVLALHPDIRAAAAAWRAAAQRYPQEIALDDPMFGYMLGPGSWGNDEVDTAYTLEVSQKVPWPGKRRLRGNIAQAEANAAYYDVGEQRLRIAESTRFAYYEYYLAHRQLAVLENSTRLLRSFREIALRRFESAQAEQQDVLLADIELGQLERQRLEYRRAERVARARINTLLLASPDARLPAPPADLRHSQPLPNATELLETSLSQRPELAAQQARIRRENYATALAHKEFYPDLEFIARYDAFWQEEPLRPMVGMNINVPLNTHKRWAAVREAHARTAQQQSTLDSQLLELSFEIEQAYRRVEELAATLATYQEHILPAARHRIEAAQASYTAGRLDFLRLVESQRSLLALEVEYYSAVAEYYQRLAALDRQTGRLMGRDVNAAAHTD